MGVLRRFERFQLILGAFEDVIEALPSLMFTLLILTLFFASIIYWVEPRDNIESVWHAMWFVLVTMTTVGYGDVSPKSVAGTCITAIMAVSSVLYMAMPLGICGKAFSDIWQDRDRVLLRRHLQDRLFHMGYGADDVYEVFRLFDGDGSGEIDFKEFNNMLTAMHIRVGHSRAEALFDLFDSDASGQVTLNEFLKTLFPKEYQQMVDLGELPGDGNIQRIAGLTQSI